MRNVSRNKQELHICNGLTVLLLFCMLQLEGRREPLGFVSLITTNVHKVNVTYISVDVEAREAGRRGMDEDENEAREVGASQDEEEEETDREEADEREDEGVERLPRCLRGLRVPCSGRRCHTCRQ